MSKEYLEANDIELDENGRVKRWGNLTQNDPLKRPYITGMPKDKFWENMTGREIIAAMNTGDPPQEIQGFLMALTKAVRSKKYGGIFFWQDSETGKIWTICRTAEFHPKELNLPTFETLLSSAMKEVLKKGEGRGRHSKKAREKA